MSRASHLLKRVGRGCRGTALLCGLMMVGAPQTIAGNTVAGGKIYAQHCQKCHGSNGKSILPGVADFSRGEGLLKADGVLLQKIKNGGGMMPAYRGILKDDDIFDVITHLRKLRR